MKDFIKNTFINVRNEKKENFSYQYECKDGKIVSMEGNISNNMVAFTITKTRQNEQKSCISIYDMPLTDECINEIAEFSEKNL